MTGAVLVTGATGGLGLSLVDALVQAGRQVVAVGRRPGSDPRLRSPNVRYLQVDLAGPGASDLCAEVSTVFHCAALSSAWGPPAAFRRANVDATRALLADAAAHGAATFIHVSSPSIYAEMRDRCAITDADLPAATPLNAYAATKLEAERLVLQAGGALRTAVVRPRAIVGPDDAAILPRLATFARGGSVRLPNGGRALVEFTDVRDVVSALLLTEQRIEAVVGRGINISGGEPVSVREVATGLADALGLSLRIRSLPMAVARPLARALETLSSTRPGAPEPRLTRYVLATLAYSQTFDLSFARQSLGWAPDHSGFATLIAQARRLRCAG